MPPRPARPSRLWDEADGRSRLPSSSRRGPCCAWPLARMGGCWPPGTTPGGCWSVRRPAGAVVREEAAGGEPVRGVAFSPDGKTLAWAAGPHVRVAAAGGGGEVLLLRGHGGTVRQVRFSPTGGGWPRRVPTGRVRLWDAATGEHLLELGDERAWRLSRASWCQARGNRRGPPTPAGTSWAWPSGRASWPVPPPGTTSMSGTLTRHKVAVLRQQADDWPRAVGLATPDGLRLLVEVEAGQRPLVNGCRADRGGRSQKQPFSRLVAADAVPPRSPDCSPTRGRRSIRPEPVCCWRQRTATTCSWATWSPGVWRRSPAPGRALAACFGPDGRRAASVSGDGTVTAWDLRRRAGGGPLPRATRAGRRRPCWLTTRRGGGWRRQPGGSEAGAIAGEVAARYADTGKELSAVGPPLPAPTQALAFSPGRRHPGSGLDRTAGRPRTHVVTLYDAGTGQAVRTLASGAAPACLAFGPDGSRLACGDEGGLYRGVGRAAGRAALTLRGHARAVRRPGLQPRRGSAGLGLGRSHGPPLGRPRRVGFTARGCRLGREGRPRNERSTRPQRRTTRFVLGP